MTRSKKTLVLNSDQMQKKIQRMAWEIYEQNYSEKEIIIAGIADRGVILAKRITKILSEISDIKIENMSLCLDKKETMRSVLKATETDYSNKVIVLVDDVLKSGKTLMYGAQYFMQRSIKKLMTAILVDRNYKSYPIKADVVGISLSTTMQEHVSVKFEKEEAVYLE